MGKLSAFILILFVCGATIFTAGAVTVPDFTAAEKNVIAEHEKNINNFKYLLKKFNSGKGNEKELIALFNKVTKVAPIYDKYMFVAYLWACDAIKKDPETLKNMRDGKMMGYGGDYGVVCNTCTGTGGCLACNATGIKWKYFHESWEDGAGVANLNKVYGMQDLYCGKCMGNWRNCSVCKGVGKLVNYRKIKQFKSFSFNRMSKQPFDRNWRAFFIGKYLLNNKNISTDDQKRARLFMKYAAEAKVHPAEYHYSVVLREGIGGKVDVQKADVYLFRAVKKRDPEAIVALGNIYFKNNDMKNAEKMAILACSYIIPEGCLLLAKVYGKDPEKPEEESIKFYRLASDMGNAEAQEWIAQWEQELHERLLKKVKALNEYFPENNQADRNSLTLEDSCIRDINTIGYYVDNYKKKPDFTMKVLLKKLKEMQNHANEAKRVHKFYLRWIDIFGANAEGARILRNDYHRNVNSTADLFRESLGICKTIDDSTAKPSSVAQPAASAGGNGGNNS